MSQALTTIPSFSSLITSSSSSSTKLSKSPSQCCLKVQMSSLPQNVSLDAPTSNTTLSPVSRRNTIELGIASAVLGLSSNAWAREAARKPPASPTDQERYDPNNVGDVVQDDKVKDTKKKIEDAMKQAIGKKDELGKKIEDSFGPVQEKIDKKIGQSSSKNFKDNSTVKKFQEQLPDDSFPPTESEPQP